MTEVINKLTSKMCRYLILFLCYVIGTTNPQFYGMNQYMETLRGNGNYNAGQRSHHFTNKRPKPEIRVYYESKCPDCVRFFTAFKKVVEQLGSWSLDISTFPYGNAMTYDFGNGTIEFQCQHGPAECYGNKLHACALDQIPNYQQALVFTGILMETDSTDAGTDQAAAMMHINPEPIKYCAKSRRGSELLKHYGKLTHALNINSVPHVLINGVQWQGNLNDFMGDVCAAYKSPPAACRPYL